MRLRARTLGTMALLTGLLVAPATAQDSRSTTDLREAAPNDAFLAIWGKHNSERDYQRQYHEAVWKTIEETKIVEEFLNALRGTMSEDEAGQVDQMLAVIKGIVEPIDWDALAKTEEALYCQKLEGPTSQHLLMMKVPDDGAKSLVDAINKAFGLIEQLSGGQVPSMKQTIAGVEFSTLELPPSVPMRPYVAATSDGMFVFTTSAAFLEEGMKLLKDPSATSKFDDSRCKEAMKQLPEAEDSITFFDGKTLFQQLNGITGFVRQMSAGNPEGARVAAMMDDIFGEVSAFDYEVTVEYTDGFQNRTASYGKVVEGYKDKLVGQMVASGKPFENWNRWVPANAKSYSLSTGANMHLLYAWVMKMIPKHFPEAERGLETFAAVQKQIGINLDEDILQSFSGESISLSLPGNTISPLGTPMDKSVMLMRCKNPTRIKELMDRGVAKLMEIPQVQQAGVEMKPVDGMEGFEEVSIAMLAQMGIKPVVGFKDGWMVMASDISAVKTVMETKQGSGETIIDSKTFKSFNLPISGPVMSVSYQNTGENTRAMAKGIQQAGAMIPMAMGMAAQNGADISKAQPFLALIPSVGKIVGAMDFYDKKLSVTQPGDGLSYKRYSVTLIKPPKE